MAFRSYTSPDWPTAGPILMRSQRVAVSFGGSGESAKSSLGHTSPALIQGNDMEGEPRAAVRSSIKGTSPTAKHGVALTKTRTVTWPRVCPKPLGRARASAASLCVNSATWTAK